MIAALIAVSLKTEISMPMLSVIYNSSSLILTIGILVVVMILAAQYGLSHAPSVQANIILLFALVVAAIASYLLTDETIEAKEWLGGAIILIASLFTDKVTETTDIAEQTTSLNRATSVNAIEVINEARDYRH